LDELRLGQHLGGLGRLGKLLVLGRLDGARLGRPLVGLLGLLVDNEDLFALLAAVLLAAHLDGHDVAGEAEGANRLDVHGSGAPRCGRRASTGENHSNERRERGAKRFERCRQATLSGGLRPPLANTVTRSAAPRWGRVATPSTRGRSRRSRR